MEQNKPFKAIIYEKYDENDSTKNYFGCSLRRHVLRDAEHFNDPTNMAMGAWLHDPRSRPATRIISHMTYLTRQQMLKEESRWTPLGSLNAKNAKKLPPPIIVVKMPEVHMGRFQIKIEIKAKRYAIQYRESGEKILARFSFAKMTQDDAYKMAVEHQAMLIRKHGI